MNRSERFRARVKVERQVLSTINSLQSNCPLRGLSVDAIRSWENSSSHPVHMRPTVAKVAGILTEIATKLRIEADSSQVVFKTEIIDDAIAAEMTQISGIFELQ